MYVYVVLTYNDCVGLHMTGRCICDEFNICGFQPQTCNDNDDFHPLQYLSDFIIPSPTTVPQRLHHSFTHYSTSATSSFLHPFTPLLALKMICNDFLPT